jgi:16S rRNA A1518/A1519 N6-dimethyltransferase RsmA/KsgA/DIM1 with predicted DNA glycosylase/AP lyase activity
MSDELAPFVPSPQDVIHKMLEIAHITSDDTVIDLGCGDGRILFAAVNEYHAKQAIGYEIQDHLYHQVSRKIKQKRLDTSIQVFHKNALYADLSTATVITLYLTIPGNQRLKSILTTAPSGTRIVSHDFQIAGWHFSKMVTVGLHAIYLYNLPLALHSPPHE